MFVKNGKVTEAPAQPFTTRYGTKQVVTVVTEDGQIEKIWFDAGRAPHCSLMIGDSVQIVFEQNQQGKPIRKLSVPGYSGNGGHQQQPANTGYPAQQQNTQQASGNFQSPAQPDTEKVLDYVKGSVELLEICIDEICLMVDNGLKVIADKKGFTEEDEIRYKPTAVDKFYQDITSEDVRTMATTLFIAAQRKYNI